MIGLPTPTRDAEFAEFVNTASPSLSGTAYLLTGDRDSAAELAREALIRTYLAWRKVRHGDAMASAGGSRLRHDRRAAPIAGANARWTTATSW
jgi:hypothetical protein